MQAKPRPPATPAEALSAMDHLTATSMIGQQEVPQQVGLSVPDLPCCARVTEAGKNLLTPGALGARAHVPRGAVTGILNRLERAGYVVRRPDPADRRRGRVAAKPNAEARIREIYEPY